MPDAHHHRINGWIDEDSVHEISRLVPIDDPARRQQLARQREVAEARRARQAAVRAQKARIAAEKRRAEALALRSTVGDIILPGVLNLPRGAETAPYDGCKKIQKGLIMGGGFMLFTCEKLLPGYPISQQERMYVRYGTEIMKEGWRRKPDSMRKHVKYVRDDGLGCEAHLDIRLFTDRSMNEPQRPASDRKSHRQIVFMAQFYGKPCERYYPVVKALAAGSEL